MRSILYIDGVPTGMGKHQLKGMFSTFGNVLSVDIFHPGMACSSGIGTVAMARSRDARKAVLTLHRSYLGGNLLLVFHAPHAANSLQRVKTPLAPFGRARRASSFFSKNVLRREGNRDASGVQAGAGGNPIREEPLWGEPWDNTPPVVLCGPGS